MRLDFFIRQLSGVSTPDLKMRASVDGRQNVALRHGLRRSKQCKCQQNTGIKAMVYHHHVAPVSVNRPGAYPMVY